MRTRQARAAMVMVATAELALMQRNHAVFARLREAVDLNPSLTADLLDAASSEILEKVHAREGSRICPAGAVGRGFRRPVAPPSSRPIPPDHSQAEKDVLK